MTLPTHISPEDLSLFALQLLPEAEQAAIAQHLATCAECREELGRIQGDLVAYAMTAEPETPPPAARERLLQAVAKEKKFVAPAARVEAIAPVEPSLASRSERRHDGLRDDSNVVPIRRSAIGWAGWVGWAAAAAITAVAGLQFHDREALQQQVGAQNVALATATAHEQHSQSILNALTDHDALQVGMHLPASDANEPPVPQGHASYVPGTGTLVFVASHMPQLQNYKTYELWVLPKDGRDPIAAGLFKPDVHGNASVTSPAIPRGVEAQGFGVTVEDDGGSKAGPTKPIVLVGVGE